MSAPVAQYTPLHADELWIRCGLEVVDQQAADAAAPIGLLFLTSLVATILSGFALWRAPRCCCGCPGRAFAAASIGTVFFWDLYPGIEVANVCHVEAAVRGEQVSPERLKQFGCRLLSQPGYQSQNRVVIINQWDFVQEGVGIMGSYLSHCTLNVKRDECFGVR